MILFLFSFHYLTSNALFFHSFFLSLILSFIHRNIFFLSGSSGEFTEKVVQVLARVSSNNWKEWVCGVLRSA